MEIDLSYWPEDAMTQASTPQGHIYPSADAILARLDERTKGMADDVADLKKSIEAVRADVDKGQLATKKEIEEFREEVEKKLDGHDTKYVSKAEYAIVRTLVFSAAGVMLLAVLGALIALVVKSQGGAP